PRAKNRLNNELDETNGEWLAKFATDRVVCSRDRWCSLQRSRAMHRPRIGQRGRVRACKRYNPLRKIYNSRSRQTSSARYQRTVSASIFRSRPMARRLRTQYRTYHETKWSRLGPAPCDPLRSAE